VRTIRDIDVAPGPDAPHPIVSSDDPHPIVSPIVSSDDPHPIVTPCRSQRQRPADWPAGEPDSHPRGVASH